MPPLRDAMGRFIRRVREELSPAYRRRIENAQQRGKSLEAARGHATSPRRAPESRNVYGTLQYEKSLHVLARMRAGDSLTEAARNEEISPDTVRRYVGSALQRDGRQFRPKPVDTLYRSMEFLGPRGYVFVEPANSREAAKIARYANAVRRYLEYGDEHALRRFRASSVRLRGGVSEPFLTDLEAIDQLAAAGVLSFTSIYRLTA